MIRSSFFVASILLLATVFYLLGELSFLAPYRSLLIHRYSSVIGWYSLALFLNLSAAVYVFNRKFLLQDTGKKLTHFEKQIQSGGSISEELTQRLAE